MYLSPGGIVRIAVLDIKIYIAEYNNTGDADTFLGKTFLCTPELTSFVQKLKLLLVGARNHQWMYDGKSLSNLLQKHGFVSIEIMPVEETTISNPGPLNLRERNWESLYVEARKPRHEIL